MLVRNIMTKDILTAKPDDTLEKVLDLFAKKKVSGCPVVSGKKVVGIITQTDILKMIDVHSKIQSAESGLFPLILAAIKSEHYEGSETPLRTFSTCG